MAIFKCKMCGGQIEISESISTCTCDYCGTEQTLPKVIDNEKLVTLHNRAVTLRMKCEFDKAIVTYENIISENPNDAEAHWGLLLCKYGIEYVDDPKTGKKVPTCHRTQIKSIFEDIDYKTAIENTDVVSRRLYEEEAEYIESVQKKILAITQKEEPYDIFICYKESDSNGKRTRDSLIAQELYEELTKRKYKVFFAKITLESKLGSQYEPYIFSALRSSKVMLVIGTKPEYFNAVWVKNEWSRFLMMLNEEGSEKYLIPCFRDMDAYDMPDELLPFQSQDMNKLGFVQDLTRGIDKIFDRREEVKKEQVTVNNVVNGININALLKRSEILISEGSFDEAKEKIDTILDNDPENAMAYVLLLLIDLRVERLKNLVSIYEDFSSNINYIHAIDYADNNLKEKLEEYKLQVLKNIKSNKKYNEALNFISIKKYEEAIELLETIKEFKDSSLKIKECKQSIEDIKDGIYNGALFMMSKGQYDLAISEFEKILEYKDSKNQIQNCNIQKEYQRKKNIYDTALMYVNKKEFEKAIEAFETIECFEDVKDKIEETKILFQKQKEENYKLSKKYIEEYEYERAKSLLERLNGFENSDELLNEVNKLLPLETKYRKACEILNKVEVFKYIEASSILKELNDYRDSKLLLKDVENKTKKVLTIGVVLLVSLTISLIFGYFIPNGKYNEAMSFINQGDYYNAEFILDELDGYGDSENKLVLIKAQREFEKGNYERGAELIESIDGQVYYTYDANGGELYEQNTETLADKLGYNFLGWELSSFVIDYYNYKADVDLTAKWSSPIQYTISYELNGGTNDSSNPTTYTVEDQITIYTPTKSGYEFMGWTGNSHATPILNMVINKGTATNIILTAHWGKELVEQDGIRYCVGDGVAKITDYIGTDKNVVIPSTISLNGIKYSVTTIGYEAFYWCSSLTSITIPNSVTSIDACAFYHCSSLTSVTIPNGVTTIEYSAFRDCKSLTSITIPNSVTSIGYCAFDGCSSLTSITIPNSVTSIGEDAFRGCSSLTSITIPNSVTSIEGSAFQKCSSLTSITIPNSVTFIGSHAFSYCDSLTSVTISNSVTKIGDSAFWYCKSLESITVDPNNKVYDSRDNSNAIIETSSNTLIAGCKNTVIPNSVTSIGNSAFRGCSSLTSITIPNSVTTIEKYAFSNCSSLESITVDSNNKVYDSRDNSNAIIETSSNTLIAGCKKTVIPNSVTSIGSHAFSYCDSLTSITIPNSVSSIGEMAFYECSSLTSITIPNSVTSIGEDAFRGCSSLTSITIPNSVTTIEYSAFRDCYSLTSITIPNSVTSIEGSAFQNCRSLTSITIPNSVTSIGHYAFYDCYSLTIYCEAISKPSGWDSNWNASNELVYWGGEWEYVDGVPTPKE